MKVVAGWVILLTLATGRSFAAGAAFGLAERALTASKIYAAVQTYFAHWQAVPELNLDTTYRAYLNEVIAAESRDQFDRASLEFLAAFRNGHTYFDDDWLWETHGQPLGFRAAPDARGTWRVLDSRVPGLAPGDRVTDLDGAAFEEFFQSRRRYISASSERAARFALSELPFLFPARFTLTLHDGRRVPVARGHAAPAPSPTLEARWLRPGEIAYLRLPRLDEPRFEDGALAALERFRDAATLIIDVRGNRGGATPIRLVSALMDRPYRYWLASTPLSVGLFRHYRELSLAPAAARLRAQDRDFLEGLSSYFTNSQLTWTSPPIPPLKLFAGRLLALIDGYCASACEDFLVPLKTTGRALLVGETTFGSSGEPYVHEFGNGMRIKIGAKRQYFPDGSPFEGLGIRPDVEVAREHALDAALELAGEGGRK
jgi:carboxyl-terminal processing protease